MSSALQFWCDGGAQHKNADLPEDYLMFLSHDQVLTDLRAAGGSHDHIDGGTPTVANLECYNDGAAPRKYIVVGASCWHGVGYRRSRLHPPQPTGTHWAIQHWRERVSCFVPEQAANHDQAPTAWGAA